jgi:hypothetical protein
MTIWLEKIKRTSRGGALAIYKSNEVMPYKRGRGDITEFSPASRKKLAFVASNAACEWESMITLTYARDYPRTGKVIKKDLNAFLTLLRKKLDGVKYLWFLEFQKRGAPHVHVLVSEPFDLETSETLGKSWSKRVIKGREYGEKYTKWVYWFNGTTRKIKGVRGCEFWQDAKAKRGLSRYTVKYATKMEQKDVPAAYVNVGRFWGGTKDLVEFTEDEDFGEFVSPPSPSKLFPGKPLKGIPKYIFGD